MSTWLTTIVINSARMKLRRRLSQVTVALDETDEEQNVSVADTVSDTRPDPEQVFRMREIGETLADAISRLSPTLCRTFQLHDVEGFSIYEIAHSWRVPSGTVKTRLSRARMRPSNSSRRAIGKGGRNLHMAAVVRGAISIVKCASKFSSTRYRERPVDRCCRGKNNTM